MPASRKLLTTAQVSDVLGGVGTAFVRGEIRDGRLRCAIAIERPGKKTHRLIDPIDLADYCERHAKGAIERLRLLVAA